MILSKYFLNLCALHHMSLIREVKPQILNHTPTSRPDHYYALNLRHALKPLKGDVLLSRQGDDSFLRCLLNKFYNPKTEIMYKRNFDLLDMVAPVKYQGLD